MENEKKAIKKLQLNKKTIAALTNDEMYMIKGGDMDEGDGSRNVCFSHDSGNGWLCISIGSCKKANCKQK